MDKFLLSLTQLLEWCRQNLPSLFLAFGLGFKEGEKERSELKRKLLEEETKRKLAENEATVLKSHIGKSDADIVGEAAKRK